LRAAKPFRSVPVKAARERWQSAAEAPACARSPASSRRTRPSAGRTAGLRLRSARLGLWPPLLVHEVGELAQFLGCGPQAARKLVPSADSPAEHQKQSPSTYTPTITSNAAFMPPPASGVESYSDIVSTSVVQVESADLNLPQFRVALAECRLDAISLGRQPRNLPVETGT